MIRLPTAALARPVQSVGDLGSISPPLSDEDTVSPSKSSSSRVLRNRFFLEHDSSAKLHDIYQLEDRPLGEGGFGTVYRARSRLGGSVVRAVKKLVKRDGSVAAAKKEAAILKRLDHPYICRLLETYEGSTAIYLVMELAEGQELFRYIQERMHLDQPLNEGDGLEIMARVYDALNYCHGQGVLHRDCKPENIMVRSAFSSESSSSKAHSSDLKVKVIDFGLATLGRHSERRRGPGSRSPTRGSLVGTYSYLAPEVREDAIHTAASDVWAAGMVLHALLLGGLPDEEVRHGSKPLDFRDEAYSVVTPAAQMILSQVIQVEPQKRLTAAEAAAACAEASDSSRDLALRLDSGADSKAIMTSLVSFHRSTMLRRAVLTALAMQMAGEQMNDLKQRFLEADNNGDGKLSREELANSIASSGDASETLSTDVAAWVESVFDSLDTDGSDSIEYTEWLAAALKEGALRCEEAIRAAFRVFDTDQSGKISVLEFSRVLQETPAEIGKLLPDYDLNRDGEIDIDEFRQLVTGSPEFLGVLGNVDSPTQNAASPGDVEFSMDSIKPSPVFPQQAGTSSKESSPQGSGATASSIERLRSYLRSWGIGT